MAGKSRMVSRGKSSLNQAGWGMLLGGLSDYANGVGDNSVSAIQAEGPVREGDAPMPISFKANNRKSTAHANELNQQQILGEQAENRRLSTAMKTADYANAINQQNALTNMPVVNQQYGLAPGDIDPSVTMMPEVYAQQRFIPHGQAGGTMGGNAANIDFMARQQTQGFNVGNEATRHTNALAENNNSTLNALGTSYGVPASYLNEGQMPSLMRQKGETMAGEQISSAQLNRLLNNDTFNAIQHGDNLVARAQNAKVTSAENDANTGRFVRVGDALVQPKPATTAILGQPPIIGNEITKEIGGKQWGTGKYHETPQLPLQSTDAPDMTLADLEKILNPNTAPAPVPTTATTATTEVAPAPVEEKVDKTETKGKTTATSDTEGATEFELAKIKELQTAALSGDTAAAQKLNYILSNIKNRKPSMLQTLNSNPRLF